MLLPRVFGWLADHSGCGYYRIMLPLSELARRGAADTAFNRHNIYASPADGSVGDGDGEPAIIIGQRISTENASRIWQSMAGVDRFRLVYEIDDDLFNIDPSNARAHQVFGEPEMRRRMADNLAVADLVTVSTEPLARQMRQYNDNVVVIGNYVDAAALTFRRPAWSGLTVGWSASATHHADIAAVAPWLRDWFRHRSTTVWHSFGYDYGPQVGAVRRRFTRWRDIVEDQRAYFQSLQWDIGIAPLADTVFNQSKSGLRAVEHAAAGIPIVASNVAPYADTVIDGVTGFLVSNRRQWLRALDTLAGDAELRAAMGAAARDVAAEWTIQANGHRWVDALGSLKW